MGLKAENSRREREDALLRYHGELFRRLGPQKWWPARTRLEMILGAVLTQNTNWRNAAMALRSLRRAGLLRLPRLRRASQADLERHIRHAGFFRQKARTIRDFLDYLAYTYHDSLAAMFARPAKALRRELLSIRGLGPETVDAILLYAGRQPFFVADAYTRRILARHALLPPDAGYSQAQEFLHRQLPREPALFNEFHALLVEVGKRYCPRRAPRCAACPLRPFLPQQAATGALPEASQSGVRLTSPLLSSGPAPRLEARAV